MARSLDLRVDDGQTLELQESRTTARERIPDDVEPQDDELVNVATIEPIPPNGGYAWVCTFAVFLINAHTWGVNSVSASIYPSGHDTEDSVLTV